MDGSELAEDLTCGILEKKALPGGRLKRMKATSVLRDNPKVAGRILQDIAETMGMGFKEDQSLFSCDSTPE